MERLAGAQLAYCGRYGGIQPCLQSGAEYGKVCVPCGEYLVLERLHSFKA
jgi:hypothetical protein